MRLFFRTISKCCFSKFKQDLSGKYAIYDEMIKDYSKVGNNINTSLMNTFVVESVPKISRNTNYMSKLSKILKSLPPHFKDNFQFYKEQQLFGLIINLYYTMNIHRAQLFQLAEKAFQNFQNVKFSNLLNIYSSMIELHHNNSLEFKLKLKQHLLNQLMNENFQAKFFFRNRHFELALRTLKYMLMDTAVDLDQSQQLLNYIQHKIMPEVTPFSLLQRSMAMYLAFIKELIQLSGLKISTKRFSYILDLSYQHLVSLKQQSSNKFIQMKNFNISLSKDGTISSQGYLNQKNNKMLNHGLSSVFQTIFAKILDINGYDFNKNVIIGIFQYDFVIKGKKFKIYRPFENINNNVPFQPITLQQQQIFKSMTDFNKIKIDQKLQTPVVLNLDGPLHYIDSDVYGNERVTRTDQIKGIFLKNHGYTHYNTVHYSKWEKVHQKGVQIQEYIEQLISNNLLQLKSKSKTKSVV